MIMISSKAGQRLAKARFREQKACEAFQVSEMEGDFYAWRNAKDATQKAAIELADELIADKHHLVEGD